MRSLKIISTLVTTAGLMIMSSPVLANHHETEDVATKIARAMSAGPASVSAEAKIVDTDGTVLRDGNNGWTCLPSTMPGDKVPMCNDDTWMALMAAMMAQKPYKADRVGISYMLQGDIPTNNNDPYDTTRDEGEPWVQEGPHVMIVVPNAESLEGIPDTPDANGHYVMWKNTPYVHIMAPLAPRE